MMDSGSFPAALRRNYHYWFKPAGYDTTLKSNQGIVTFGEGLVVSTLINTPYDIVSTGSLTITVDDGTENTDRYKVGWLIAMSPGFYQVDPNLYMLGQITSYVAGTYAGTADMTFTIYQSKGSGTYVDWYVRTQWENAANYIQNPQYSAKELSARYYQYHTAEFNWPYATTYEVFTTSNTNILKSGYTEATYDGQTIVQEDEHDINRPYIGVTASSSRVLTSTTNTTTFDYTVDPPIINTVTTETTETKTHSHTYSSDDFDTSGAGYAAGNPAVYSDGQIVSFPTASFYTKKVDIDETYVFSSYEDHFEEYPSGSGIYRPVLLISMSTAWSVPTGNPISPADFFHPG
jgi:hypothetical protein